MPIRISIILLAFALALTSAWADPYEINQISRDDFANDATTEIRSIINQTNGNTPWKYGNNFSVELDGETYNFSMQSSLSSLPLSVGMEICVDYVVAEAGFTNTLYATWDDKKKYQEVFSDYTPSQHGDPPPDNYSRVVTSKGNGNITITFKNENQKTTRNMGDDQYWHTYKAQGADVYMFFVEDWNDSDFNDGIFIARIRDSATVPEPSTLLFGLMLAGFAFLRKRNRTE